MEGSHLLKLAGIHSIQESQSYNEHAELHGHDSNEYHQDDSNLQQNRREAVEQMLSAVYGDSQHDVHELDNSSDGEPAPKPKYGKKTRGRVKIKMQFINNKLRRYTTFSKRKTGIMKKAYELSTLTGTQVMLLVASETGHVYTFATKKLQPMITSESGKALIQTCLNSPENGTITQHDLENDRRMNPNGFEETELCYAVAEDEESETSREVHEVMLNSNAQSDGQANQNQGSSSIIQTSSNCNMSGNTFNINTIIPPTSNSDGTMGKVTNLTMQVPQPLPIQGNITVQQQQSHPQQQQHILFSTGSNGSSGQQVNTGQQLNPQIPQRVTDYETASDRQLQRQKEEQQQEIDRLTQLTQLNQEQLLHNQLQLQQLQVPQSHMVQQLSNQNTSQLNNSQHIMIPKSALLTVRGNGGGGGVGAQVNNTVLYQSPQNQALVYTAAAPTIPNIPEGVALVNIVTSQPSSFSTSQMGTISTPAQPQYITIPISQLTNNPVLQQVMGERKTDSADDR